MKTHHDLPGSPEWHARRGTCFNASDAPAMLGCSPHETRGQLLARLHSGVHKEFSSYAQERVIDPGHEYEAKARPVAEEIIGEYLAAVGGEQDCGFSRPLGASFDGITMLGDVVWEHKRMNADLRYDWDKGNGYHLPKHYQVQMEQQLIVSGAERALFMATAWNGDTCTEQRHCWYASDPALRAEILAGWKQFDADLTAYIPRAAEPPKPTGHAPETLPALRIELTGAVTASNLSEFKETALGAIRSVNRELTTDQHFADAELAVKWCGEVESRIKAAKDHALSQTASIDALFRTLDEVSGEARRVRLDLEKLVDRRKTEIKGELIAEAKAAYDSHEAALRAECGAWKLLTPPDFGSAIKGKRSVSAMRDALDATLAQAKIRADESARTIRAALTALNEESDGYEHLFHDRLTFIGMIPEAVRLMARDRIAKHKEAEERRAAELAERERARIRREEQERADREARERLQREQEAMQRAQTPAPSPSPAPAAIAAPAPSSKPAAANSPNVVLLTRGRPSLRLGQINERIAPLAITAAGLEALGFKAAGKEGAAVLFHEADFPAMVDSMVASLRTAQHRVEEPAAA